MSGYRLAVVRFKTPKEKMNDPAYRRTPTMCVSLPVIELSITPVCLSSALSVALAGMQDDALRSVVANAIEEFPGINLVSIEVPLALGTAEGLAGLVSSTATRGRVSAASLGAWFDAVLCDPLLDLLMTKIPASAEAPEIAVRQVEGAKKAICALASPRSTMPGAVAIQLRKAVSLAPVGDRMRVFIDGKLELFINPPASAELLLNL